MADITMCRDSECKDKITCYRYNATPNKYYQSYFLKSPREPHACEYYWDYEEGALKSKINRTK
jgi:hypothetical protein